MVILHQVNVLNYTDDPLRDGVGCLPENNCCYDAEMPWFFHRFSTTNENTEVRIHHDQAFSDEGILVEQVQLYVQ